jgi:hypothetical protein
LDCQQVCMGAVIASQPLHGYIFENGFFLKHHITHSF